MATVTQSTDPAVETAEVQFPASTNGEVKTRKVKGETKLISTCRFCERELELSDEHWYKHSGSGRFHIRSRCRDCDREYRADAKRQLEAGNRTVSPRGSGGKTAAERLVKATVALEKAEARLEDAKAKVAEAKKVAAEAEREAKAEAKEQAKAEAEAAKQAESKPEAEKDAEAKS